jgi:hypothetical protein
MPEAKPTSTPSPLPVEIDAAFKLGAHQTIAECSTIINDVVSRSTNYEVLRAAKNMVERLRSELLPKYAPSAPSASKGPARD